MISGPWPVDLAFSHWLQNWQSDGLTGIMKTFSFIGQPLLYAPLFLLLSAWWYNQGKRSLAVLVLLVIAGNLLSAGLKDVFDRPRPTAEEVTIVEVGQGFGFPSGHALGAMLIGGFGIFMARIVSRGQGWLTLIGLVLPIAVGVSRVYLGAHWLTDVLAGYAAALVWLLVIFGLLWPKIRLKMTGPEEAPVGEVPLT